MKRKIKLLISIFSIFFAIGTVNAGSGKIAVTSSLNQVIVGNNVVVYVTVSSASPLGSWEYTLNYDKNVFKLVSSDVGLHYAASAGNANTKSVSYKYTFKALKSGSAKFYVDSSLIFGFDESLFSVSNGSKTIKTMTYAEYQNTLSKNNNLKSLAVEGSELSPKFNKDTLEYTVKVNEDVKNIKITAAVEDSKAKASGTGSFEVSAGNNTFEIVVVAENGSEKTYKIIVDVIDKNPINVNVDGKNYTVVKLKENLTKPESYQENTHLISGFEIPVFYSEITEFTLVGLKGEDGIVELYIYENDTYKKYNELSFGALTIYPLEIDIEKEEYTKSDLTIQNVKVDVLEKTGNERFKLINGLNVETKEEGLYLYDSKDNTLIKYSDDDLIKMKELNQMYLYLIIGFAALSFISLIIIIVLLAKKGNKKKIKNNKKTKKNDE